MLITSLKGIAVFVLLGPAIGFLTVTLATTDDWSWGALTPLIPIAYFIGGVPAAISGLFVGLAESRLHGPSGCVIAGVVSAVCSAGYYLLMAGGDVPGRVIALLMGAGFIAGSISGAVFLSVQRLGSLRESVRFKGSTAVG